jgi:hypothetical protein
MKMGVADFRLQGGATAVPLKGLRNSTSPKATVFSQAKDRNIYLHRNHKSYTLPDSGQNPAVNLFGTLDRYPVAYFQHPVRQDFGWFCGILFNPLHPTGNIKNGHLDDQLKFSAD